MGGNTHEEPFPWHLGVYDAHCHPTDTMSALPSISSMKTRVLTVMATRSQDQELVASIAETHGIKSPKLEQWSREECIVPCFGWHPWFAHQMYVTTEGAGDEKEQEKGILEGEAKVEHYRKIFKRETIKDEDRRTFLALPNPAPFSAFLAQTRTYLEKYPLALIGEIGLDRGIRIPEPEGPTNFRQGDENMTPGSREGKKLTAFKPDPQHQKLIFKMQMQLAAEMGRAVSIHGVQAHGMLFDAVKELFEGHEKKVLSKKERKKLAQEHNPDPSHEEEGRNENGNSNQRRPPYPPRICLHSYSGDFSNLSRYLQPSVPIDIFVSFSTAINLSDALESDTPQNFIDLIKKIPDQCLLVESDLHVAGEDMDRRMEDIVRRICTIRGWGLDEGVRILGENWRTFVFGHEGSIR
ncbi:Metallo-dependent hydrolase [Pleomassaria siparia CBS 279.74]|uniref:Metallo-dependent hydrolase n=1 Tax=Pleomassaria siparia CBS 279.74 TaxID=1314801 RepID=A0A6G1KJZ9_9PLEO|nr:Metallo-dependent hydrolase [Pleomassaria siparia CBS 279.74]